MSNIAVTIGHGIETAAVDTTHVAEKVFGDIPKVIEVLSTALADEPKIEAAVVGLVQEFGTLTADGAAAVAGKGANIAADGETISAAEALYQYMKATLVPAVEALYTDIRSDITAAVKPAATPATPAQ